MVMSDEMAPQVEAEAFHAAPAAPKAMSRSMQVENSALISADFSAEYTIPQPVTLDSGAEKKRFSLSATDYDGELVLASTPRLDPRVLLTSRFEYQGATPLLAGNLSLYRDGNFVGSTHLAQQQTGEDVKLSFGEDDKVKLTFQPDPDAKSEDGVFFGKRKVMQKAYQIKLTSQHDKPFVIKLYDNIPVASHEDINVELTGDKPSERDVDDKKGVLMWQRTLQPTKEQRLEYGYRVSYPKDKRVFGFE